MGAPAWPDDEDLSEGSGDNYNEPIYEEEPLLPEEEQPEPDCDEPECPECGNCDTDSSGDEPEEPEQPDCPESEDGGNECPPKNPTECNSENPCPPNPSCPENSPNGEPCPEPEPEVPAPEKPKVELPKTCLCPEETCNPSNNGDECPPACENNECLPECEDEEVPECDGDDDECNEDCDCSECNCDECPTEESNDDDCQPKEAVCEWGDYCEWSECTKECGGRRIRSRKCNCPDGFSGEPDCVGEMFDFDEETCPQEPNCSADAVDYVAAEAASDQDMYENY